MEQQILNRLGININISLGEALVGIPEIDNASRMDTQKINHILLIAKMVISKVKYGKFQPVVNLFNQEATKRNAW